ASPVAIAEHVAFDSLFSFAPFSTSAGGNLVYVAGEGPSGSELVWFDHTGKVLGTVGQNDVYTSVSISPDGSRVVADTPHEGKVRVLLIDARGTRTLLTLGIQHGAFPVWSTDGRQIYFISNADGPYKIFSMAVDGSGDRH